MRLHSGCFFSPSRGGASGRLKQRTAARQLKNFGARPAVDVRPGKGAGAAGEPGGDLETRARKVTRKLVAKQSYEHKATDDDDELTGQLARLHRLDLAVMEELVTLCIGDEGCESREHACQLRAVPGLMAACRRPAVGAVRRRYLLALSRWPLEECRDSLFSKTDAGQRIEEAVSLCEVLAAPVSAQWRAHEAKVFRALPAEYRGEVRPSSPGQWPRLSSPLASLISYADPAAWLPGLERWNFFSANLLEFDRRWGTFLASLSSTHWQHLASLRDDRHGVNSSAPLKYYRDILHRVFAVADDAWLEAVMSRLRALSTISERLGSLECVAGLTSGEAAAALDLVGTQIEDGSAGAEYFLRRWLNLSPSWRQLALDELLPTSTLTSPTLDFLDEMDQRPEGVWVIRS